MPTTIYPSNPAEWAAFLAVLVPLITWAVGGLVGGLNERKRRLDAEWSRLHGLAVILYNNEHQTGLWGQMFAIRELRRLKSRRKDAKDLAGLAAVFFRNHPVQTDGTSVLVQELEAFSNSGRLSLPVWLTEIRSKLNNRS